MDKIVTAILNNPSATVAALSAVLAFVGGVLGPLVQLEWRIYISGSSLKTMPTDVDDSVNLMPMPAADQCLLVTVFLGPSMQNTRPKFSDCETTLLAEGTLCNGRAVWVVSCYLPMDRIPMPTPPNTTPKFIGSKEEVLQAARAGGMRALIPANHSDGSLAFFDYRVQASDRQDEATLALSAPAPTRGTLG